MHYTMYSRESIYTILASSSSISILLLNIMHTPVCILLLAVIV